QTAGAATLIEGCFGAGTEAGLPFNAVSFVDRRSVRVGRGRRCWRRIDHRLGAGLRSYVGCGRRYSEEPCNHALLRVGQGEEDSSWEPALIGLAQLEFHGIAGAEEFLLCRILGIAFPTLQDLRRGWRPHFLGNRTIM